MNGLGMTKNMSTRRHLVAVPGDTRPVDTAMSEPAVAALVEGRVGRRSSGWDPYEVWRTRVKGEQLPPADDSQPAPAA